MDVFCKKCKCLMIREIRPQTIMIVDKEYRYKKSSFLQEGLWCSNPDCDEEIIEEDFYNNKYQVMKELKKMKWEINEKI